jgi:hypothetical protein
MVNLRAKKRSRAKALAPQVDLDEHDRAEDPEEVGIVARKQQAADIARK